MSHYEQMAALRARLASAEAERDTWHASGLQENYLEAYSRVEALVLQLDDLHRAGLRSLAGSGASHISEPGVVEEQERLMAELSITYDGGQYRYGEYRYDRFDDALAYARLQRSRAE